MKRCMMTVLPVLVAAALAVAEDSLLERLQAETRELAGAVRDATVEVRASRKSLFVPRAVRSAAPFAGAASAPKSFRAPVSKSRVFHSFPGHPSAQVRGYGVLVGTPPVVVAPQSLVGDAKKITVVLAGGGEAEAERAGGDAELGIAVYRLPDDVAAERKGVEPARDWSELSTGTLAVRSGRGLDLDLVRGSDRVLGWLYGGEGPLGGALVGARGRLLGIGGGAGVAAAMNCANCHAGSDRASAYARGAPLYTWHLRRTRPARSGVHAANAYVPGPVIARVVDDLKEHGRVRHSYLGVVLGETVGEKGVEITAVMDESPAARAGLSAGLEVVSIDGVRCESSRMLSRALAMRPPGEKLTIRVRRGDDARDVAVELGDLTAARRDLVSESSFGLTCVDLTDDLRRFFGFDDEAVGVVVQDVREGSSGHRAGLRRGDLIFQGGDGSIANLEELRAALAAAKGSVSLRWRRGGGTLQNTLKVPEVKRTTR